MANVGGSSPFESRAPWLSISKVKPRFAYRCLSPSLSLSALANKPPCGYSFLLPFSFCSLPHLATFHNEPKHTPPPQKISFRAAEISLRVLFSSGFPTNSLTNINSSECTDSAILAPSRYMAATVRATTALSVIANCKF